MEGMSTTCRQKTKHRVDGEGHSSVRMAVDQPRICPRSPSSIHHFCWLSWAELCWRLMLPALSYAAHGHGTNIPLPNENKPLPASGRKWVQALKTTAAGHPAWKGALMFSYISAQLRSKANEGCLAGRLLAIAWAAALGTHPMGLGWRSPKHPANPSRVSLPSSFLKSWMLTLISPGGWITCNFVLQPHYAWRRKPPRGLFKCYFCFCRQRSPWYQMSDYIPQVCWPV